MRADPAALSVRCATIEDGDGIAPLLAELGYPTTTAEARKRLARKLDAQDAGVLVAERERELIGLASYDIVELLARPSPQCHITALVVRSAHRRAGAGTALLEAIERLARERGCFRVELTTRPDRPEALPFYRSLGFAERPVRLVKFLDGDR